MFKGHYFAHGVPDIYAAVGAVKSLKNVVQKGSIKLLFEYGSIKKESIYISLNFLVLNNIDIVHLTITHLLLSLATHTHRQTIKQIDNHLRIKQHTLVNRCGIWSLRNI